MNDKVIVTNLSALKKKYGKGYSAINRAIKKLIAADKKRAISTKLIALDNPATMKRLKSPVVTDAADPKQNKRAIDGIYRALKPEFIMILGSLDVIPHQDMKNPMFDGANDPDEFAYGDLPYACEAAYSQRAEDFIGPTRVVGRMPDLTGAKEPAYLVGLLETAANAKSISSSAYGSYLGISAKVWEKSTRLSLERLSGSGNDVRLSPLEGPNWESQLLARRMHFVNCHGTPADPNFYGQWGSTYPTAHSAQLIIGKLSEGTVAAVECCYGAELYDPSLLDSGQSGICNTYLANKAYGFFGSTTIAYGPAEGNGAADLICQFFLRRVLAGASLGRAVLEARQEFATHAPELDPADLKTLVQFNLLGDPSIYPVSAETPHHAIARTSSEKGIPALELSLKLDRARRREQLISRGLWIARNQPVAQRLQEPQRGAAKAPRKSPKAAKLKAPPADRVTLRKLISDAGLEATTTQSYIIASRARTNMTGRASAPMRMHVVLGRRADSDAPGTEGSINGLSKTVALIAREVNGKIISYRELFGKWYDCPVS